MPFFGNPKPIPVTNSAQIHLPLPGIDKNSQWTKTASISQGIYIIVEEAFKGFRQINLYDQALLNEFNQNILRDIEGYYASNPSDSLLSAEKIEEIYTKHATPLLNHIQCQDQRKRMHSFLMSLMGIIVGFIAALPLVLPYCLPSVRTYVASFFEQPAYVEPTFRAQLQDAVRQSKMLASNEIDVYTQQDTSGAYSFGYARTNP